MNKFYFKAGHLFLDLYNCKSTDDDLKIEMFERIAKMANASIDCLIDEQKRENHKMKILDILYKEMNDE